ncbi:hypothetical protein LTR53_007885 [Teratosphaeriaceae sp. CCFEE 6253]|nr:hypothetical protein LTR53_007885 [Teratosphaeriaceae sp. CCFEE 6253]
MPVLATGRHDQPCRSSLGAGTLITEVTVRQVAANARSCKLVNAEFSLQLQGSSDVDEVGTIEAYVVNRTTASIVGPSAAWVYEVLHANFPVEYTSSGGYVLSGDIRERLEQLNDDSDILRPECEAIAETLNADRVMYIQDFEIDTEYRGEGLGKLAMAGFHAALGSLSNGHAFTGTAILDAHPLDAQSRPDMSFDEQTMGLVGFYSRCGYTLWKHEDGEAGSTIMGRRL